MPTTTAVVDVGSGAFGRASLLVVSEHAARVVELPADGEVSIGRAADAGVRLDDAGVSRHHARITMRGGRASVRDLGSHNGTLVNGHAIDGERGLWSGAAIQVGATELLFRGGGAPAAAPLPPDLLSQQLSGELERALLHDRPLAIVAVCAGGSAEELVGLLSPHLRAMDRAAAWGDGVVIVLPEVGADQALTVAADLLVAVAAHRTGARAGVALFPRHADTAEDLVTCARATCDSLEPGQVAIAGDHEYVRELGGSRVIVADDAMARVYAVIDRVASTSLPVLILGETGTGKELAATAVHLGSGRAGAFIAFNCAAIPDALAESELFGHEKGAFSGADSRKPGLLHAADGGTLFLDEVVELSPALQAKLLRVIETGRFTTLGSAVEQTVDVRVVAATNRDPRLEIERGRFREDLYFRLAAATVWLPPLRERPREIPLMAAAFLQAACTDQGRSVPSLTDEARRRLLDYSWPGNVRELRHCMAFLVATCSGDTIDAWQVESQLQRGAEPPPTPAAPPPQFRPIKEEIRDLERRRMIEALEATGGNQTLAAALIEMPLRTFVAKLKQYGLCPSS